jgi:hypothetical protein
VASWVCHDLTDRHLLGSPTLSGTSGATAVFVRRPKTTSLGPRTDRRSTTSVSATLRGLARVASTAALDPRAPALPPV